MSFSLGKTAVVRIGMGWDGDEKDAAAAAAATTAERSERGNKLSGCSERALVLEGTCKVGNKVVVHVVSRRYWYWYWYWYWVVHVSYHLLLVIVVIVVHDSRVLCDIPRGSVYRIRAYTRQAARQRLICDRMH